MLALSTLLLVACGSGDSSSTEEAATTEEPAAPEIPATVELSIEGSDLMKYNTDRLEVFEGQEVTLTLTHTGKMAKNAMGHNWVLLQKGTDIAAFSAAGMTAAETDYIAPDMAEAVIAKTEMIGGGETSTITFTAPASGVYDFICSFIGHSGQMKGTFVSRGR